MVVFFEGELLASCGESDADNCEVVSVLEGAVEVVVGRLELRSHQLACSSSNVLT